MKARHKRFILIGVVLALLAGAAGLVLNTFSDNIVFFQTPSEVVAGKAPQGRTFRLGGMVVAGSLVREADGLSSRFAITDTAKSVPVRFTGALPDLFKEGKGAVAQGKLGPDGVFVATEVLAKHDENYMPPEAKDAVDRAHATSKTLK